MTLDGRSYDLATSARTEPGEFDESELELVAGAGGNPNDSLGASGKPKGAGHA